MDVFTSAELESVARETGFFKRKSKVTPSAFFDLLMYDISWGSPRSLNQLVIEAVSEHNVNVSKQGLDKKFNESTLKFLKRLMEKQLSVDMKHQIKAGWLSYFNKVIIKDGTRFDLQEDYKDHLQGSGGSASDAGACIQFEFDLKSGFINHLSLTPSRRPDRCDTLDGLDKFNKGDLVIRDLGYYCYKAFYDIIHQGAFFISRFIPKAIAYEKMNGQLIKLDFNSIYHYMQKHKLSRICKDVFVGTGEKLSVRMIIELIPDEVYEQRMRKIKKLHRKKGYITSEQYKILSRFNIFITNVPVGILPDAVVSSLYRIRWQVELIFKIWKSVFGIHQTHRMKYIRWLCLLHFKLLIILINWNIIMKQRNYIYTKKRKLLSMLKCFRTLFDNNYRLRKAIKTGNSEMKKYLLWTDRILNKNHWLENKKIASLDKIFNILVCKSNIYEYI